MGEAIDRLRAWCEKVRPRQPLMNRPETHQDVDLLIDAALAEAREEAVLPIIALLLRPNRMDAPDGPVCACGSPSRLESGECGRPLPECTRDQVWAELARVRKEAEEYSRREALEEAARACESDAPDRFSDPVTRGYELGARPILRVIAREIRALMDKLPAERVDWEGYARRLEQRIRACDAATTWPKSTRDGGGPSGASDQTEAIWAAMDEVERGPEGGEPGRERHGVRMQEGDGG